MDRSLGMERLYSLGNYKNIKFSSYINDLPEDIMLEPSVVGKLRFMQMLEIELSYRKYIQLSKEVFNKLEEGEIIEKLEEVMDSKLSELKSLLAKVEPPVELKADVTLEE